MEKIKIDLSTLSNTVLAGIAKESNDYDVLKELYFLAVERNSKEIFISLLKNLKKETKDIILLIPISDINKASKDLKQIVFNDLRNNIKNANLKILEEKPTFADFYRVGFISHMIKISAQ